MNLLRASADAGQGVFGCDERSVFADQEICVGPVKTEVISPGSAYKKEMFRGTVVALWNTKDYFDVWRKVRDLGLYKRTEWTLKVDPDTVFIPARLRSLLPQRPVPVRADIPQYLLNCQLFNSMQGPLELLSRAGADVVFGGGLERCAAEDPSLYESFGEDLFMLYCLRKVGVLPVEGFDLLADAYCGTYHAVECLPEGAAAFHPFKTELDFDECLSKILS